MTRFALSRLISEQVTINGVVVALNANYPIVSGSLAIGVYEPYETEFFLKNVCVGDVVSDIGANVGYFTALAAKACGATGRVFSFEPDAENFAFLTKTIALNHAENVKAIQKGISNTKEREPCLSAKTIEVTIGFMLRAKDER